MLAGGSLLLGLSGAVSGAGWLPYGLLAYGVLVLALVCHPDSRARIDGGVEAGRAPADPVVRSGGPVR